MIVKFLDLDVKARDYNGIHANMAIALIINEAIDYLMENHLQGMVELDVINIEGCRVDFGRESVYICTVLDFVHLH